MPQRPTLIAVSGPDAPNFHAPRCPVLGGGAPTALLAAIGLMAIAHPAIAGVTLLSRHTSIQAADSTGLLPHAGTDDFGSFANQVGNGDAPINGVLSLAHQYSAPSVLGISGSGLEGAFAEGQVRSQADAAANAAGATSLLDIQFLVDQHNAGYSIGAAMGSVGNGAATINLTPIITGENPEPIFIATLAPGEGGTDGTSRELNKSGPLVPGKYLLHVEADSSRGDSSAESNAYYNFNFTLTDSTVSSGGSSSGSPVAVPLPAAAAAGALMLGLLAGKRVLDRRSSC